MEIKDIEKFFLNTILMISIIGVFLIVVSDVLLFPEDSLSIFIAITLLLTFIIAYLIRGKYPSISVLIIAIVALATMSYQRLTVPHTMTTLTVVIIVGFVFSIMLKGRLMWFMHGIAFVILNSVFVFPLPDAVTAAITYSVLYFVPTYATYVLKSNYDRIHEYMKESNIELNAKSKEIETQNEELLQIQENLSSLNTNLEDMVNERTAKIQIQNKILLKYSYTNAHDLRGPLARLLGLATLYKLEDNPDPDFFIEKMVEQVHEIDAVVNKINIDLESGNFEMK